MKQEIRAIVYSETDKEEMVRRLTELMLERERKLGDEYNKVAEEGYAQAYEIIQNLRNKSPGGVAPHPFSRKVRQ